jgi:ketosteroid isomerase-like protein
MKLAPIAAVVCGAAFLFAAAASGQNLSLRAPTWALPLLGADIIATTGGRAILGGDGVDVAVRVTIAPVNGGVARVIRYEARGDSLKLYLHRFTGHPSTGWWLWGPDAPRVTTVGAAQGAEIASLTRATMGVAGALGGDDVGDACAGGERVFMEVVLADRSMSFMRNCAAAGDAAGRLALRLSEIAGSRDDEEFHAAAVRELLDADRAFAAKAQAEGAPAAFAAYAAADATMLSGGRDNVVGRAAIVAHFAHWPAGQHLSWSPQAGRVSERGDMGWTWGVDTVTTPGGAHATGRYISVWTRDLDGNWKYLLDASVG